MTLVTSEVENECVAQFFYHIPLHYKTVLVDQSFFDLEKGVTVQMNKETKDKGTEYKFYTFSSSTAIRITSTVYFITTTHNMSNIAKSLSGGNFEPSV